MSTRNISINIYWTLLVLLGMDAYVYMALQKSMRRHKWKYFLLFLYFVAVCTGYIGFYFLYTTFMFKPLQVSLTQNLFIGFFFSFFAFKLLLILFFLSEDLVRLLKLFFLFFFNIFRKEKLRSATNGRRKFIRQTGLIVAAIPFTSMLFGITGGKYNFKVNKVKLSFKNLPKAFNGYKIVQISDIHAGSFDDRIAIREGIELVNQQHADLILFTGDLVNNDSREILPFMEDFKELSAPDGIFSILGNHDYGDYKKWDTPQDKKDNMQLLYDYQKELGFTLLNNANATVGRGDEEIGIFGVENWGNPPFPRKGDLDQALKGRETAGFKILMTHDPTHWNKKAVPHPVHFDLTLSGHTHGMQLGIEIPGFKWSPIKYIYPQWAGLYEKKGQLLYVNRGFGFLGFPGRVGIWPEITVFELERKE